MECLFLFLVPVKGVIFFCEIEQWVGQGGVVFNEVAVEVTKTQPFLDFFHGFQGWPVADSFKFNWIHV